MRSGQRIALGLLAITLGAAGPVAAQDFDAVEIAALPVADGIYMLKGGGGNIGVSVGPDGILLIDDQFAPLTDKITAAVRKLSDGPIRFVLNTHWHSDHTGGNENFGEAGALVVAHENVRRRMSVEQLIEAFGRIVPASPEGALPVVTFNDSVTFHLNGDEIHVIHVPPSHTDGDSIVHFRKANVLHVGDLYFSGMYPLIDVSNGGSIDGLIAAVALALELTDDATKIIPGHGAAVSGRAEFVAYRDMLVQVRDRVAALIESGKSREEVAAAKPTEPLDDVWGHGYLDTDRFVSIVFDSLTK